MPFARVLFLDTNKWGIISTDKINHFSETTFVKSKKYRYLKPKGKSTLIAVSYVKDTFEEVEKTVKAKRCKIPPIQKLASASEVTDEDTGKTVKRVRNKTVSIDTKTIFHQRMAALQQKSALKKLSKLPTTSATSPLLDSLVNSPSEDMASEESASEETDAIEQQMIRIHGDELIRECQAVNVCDKNNNNTRLDNKSTNSSISNSSTEDSLENDQEFKRQTEGEARQEVNIATSPENEVETSLRGTNESVNNESQQNELNRKLPNVRIITDETLLNQPDGSGPLETQHLTNVDALRKQHSNEGKPKIALAGKLLSSQIYENPSSSDSGECLETITNEWNKSRRKIRNKRRSNDDPEISKASNSKKRHKKTRSDLDECNTSDEEFGDKLEQLLKTVPKIKKKIERLQTSILSRLESLEAKWDQLKNTPSVDPSNEALDLNRIGFPPVAGYRRKNNDAQVEIHVGQNLWILEKTYNNASQKSNSVFVKEMALTLFGEDLRNKSVTGMKAPRTLITSEALDGEKVTAIREIFTYFLRTQRFMKDEQLSEEIMKTNAYLREKINDMKKTKRAQEDADGITPSTSRGKGKKNTKKPNQAKSCLTKAKLKKCKLEEQSLLPEDDNVSSDGDSRSMKKRKRRYSI